MHAVVLAVHVVAGTAGLLLGPFTLLVHRRHGLAVGGGAYQAALAVVVVSALGLVALSPERFWWLAPIALAVQAAALTGVWLRRRRRRGWAGWYVRLVAGSYVGLLTALLVVSWSSPLAWVLPTLLGVGLVEHAAARAQSGPA